MRALALPKHPGSSPPIIRKSLGHQETTFSELCHWMNHLGVATSAEFKTIVEELSMIYNDLKRTTRNEWVTPEALKPIPDHYFLRIMMGDIEGKSYQESQRLERWKVISNELQNHSNHSSAPPTIERLLTIYSQLKVIAKNTQKRLKQIDRFAKGKRILTNLSDYETMPSANSFAAAPDPRAEIERIKNLPHPELIFYADEIPKLTNWSIANSRLIENARNHFQQERLDPCMSNPMETVYSTP